MFLTHSHTHSLTIAVIAASVQYPLNKCCRLMPIEQNAVPAVCSLACRPTPISNLFFGLGQRQCAQTPPPQTKRFNQFCLNLLQTSLCPVVFWRKRPNAAVLSGATKRPCSLATPHDDRRRLRAAIFKTQQFALAPIFEAVKLCHHVGLGKCNSGWTLRVCKVALMSVQCKDDRRKEMWRRETNGQIGLCATELDPTANNNCAFHRKSRCWNSHTCTPVNLKDVKVYSPDCLLWFNVCRNQEPGRGQFFTPFGQTLLTLTNRSGYSQLRGWPSTPAQDARCRIQETGR